MRGRPLLRLNLIILGLLVVYYVAPWPVRDNPVPTWIGVVLVVVAIIALGAVCVWQLRVFLQAPAGADLRLQSLAVLLVLVIFFFATTYYIVAEDPEAFDGIANRTDALYFTVTTLSTTGFGDIHATSEPSRLLVTVHMAFNLVFVAAIATTIGNQIRQRVQRRSEESQ